LGQKRHFLEHLKILPQSEARRISYESFRFNL
jgi:hypothetical protein